MSVKISLKELLEAGCHFGHQSQRWNPKAYSFIFSQRQGVHIIDLVKTKGALVKACEHIVEVLGGGGTIIFLGTKRQAKDIVKNEAMRSGAFYVVERWPGGLFTNYEIIKKNLEKMADIKKKLANPELQKGYTKKEILLWERDLKKLMILYGGIAELKKIPALLFVIDIKKEEGAIKEATKLGVTTIAIVDTNSDPTLIDFPIPANDDAVGSIKIIVKYIADAVEEGMKIWEKKKTDTEEVKSQKSNLKATTQKLKVKDKKEEVKEDGKKSDTEAQKIGMETLKETEKKAEKKTEKPETKKRKRKKKENNK